MLAFPRLVKTVFKNPCSTRANLLFNFSVTLKTEKKVPNVINIMQIKPANGSLIIKCIYIAERRKS